MMKVARKMPTCPRRVTRSEAQVQCAALSHPRRQSAKTPGWDIASSVGRVVASPPWWFGAKMDAVFSHAVQVEGRKYKKMLKMQVGPIMSLKTGRRKTTPSQWAIMLVKTHGLHKKAIIFMKLKAMSSIRASIFPKGPSPARLCQYLIEKPATCSM